MPTATGTDRVRVLSSFGSGAAGQPEDYPVSADTTAGDLASQVLAKHGVSRDPRLYYFTLDSGGGGGGGGGGGLPDEARLLPRLLTAPAGKPALLVMHMRSGGLVKIHDSDCLMPGGYCKSLFVSKRTTASQVLRLLLDSYGMPADQLVEFALSERDGEGRELRQLDADDCPLAIQQSHKDLAIHLKRRLQLDKAGMTMEEAPAEAASAAAAVPTAESRNQEQRKAGGGGGGSGSGSGSENLARLRDSFRNLQRLRSENRELYERTLLTRPTEPAEAAAVSELRARLRGGGGGGANDSSRRRGAQRRLLRLEGIDAPMSARDAPRSARLAGAAGPVAAGGSVKQRRSAEAEEATQFRRQTAAAESSSSASTAARSSVRSVRSEVAQRRRAAPVREASPPLAPSKTTPTPTTSATSTTPTTPLTPTTPTSGSGVARRMLPRLPAGGPDDLVARRARAELAAQRQLSVTRRDFQCQVALEEAAEPVKKAERSRWTPTLAELLSVCTLVCRRLHRRSYADAWGIQCYAAQLQLPADGGVADADARGGPAGRRPALGALANGDAGGGGATSGAFRSNARLLERLRRLVAIDRVAEHGAAGGADSGLRSGDLLVEVNGESVLAVSPVEAERMLNRQRTLRLLVARPRPPGSRNGDLEPDEESIAAASAASASDSAAAAAADNSEAAGGLRLQLRRLRLRCQELAERASGFERQAEQLRSLLASRARVRVLESAASSTSSTAGGARRQLPSTGQPSVSPASRASFKVIREPQLQQQQQRPDEITSTV